MYIYKLDDIANEHNNTYHRTIKIKSNDVKVPWTYVINDLNGEGIIGRFY